MVVSQNSGAPTSKDHSVLGSILGVPLFWETTKSGRFFQYPVILWLRNPQGSHVSMDLGYTTPHGLPVD